VLLPPIIFNSGHTMRSRLFFANFNAIMTFAIVGTLFSTFVVAGLLFWASENDVFTINLSFDECLTFGSLISATDPVSTLAVFAELKVDVTLFYIVFGESVLNDAVAIVLFRVFSSYVTDEYDHSPQAFWYMGIINFLLIFVCSALVGIIFGFLSAILLKTLRLRDNRVIEMTIYLIACYAPYLISEALELSGIVSILFTGIVMKRYTSRNLSDDTTRDYADFIFRMLAQVQCSILSSTRKGTV
jgi:NhaP-type Na+/H+ or K+/H+ antiporter